MKARIPMASRTEVQRDKLVEKHAVMMTIALQGIRDLCDLHEDTGQSVGDAKKAMRYINKIARYVLDETNRDVMDF